MYIYMYTHNKRYRTTFPFFTSSFFSGHVFHFFPQICKKNAATPFFFEFWKVFVYVLTFSFIFAETCCKKKGGYIFWSMIDVFGPYISECFLHVSSHMLQNNVATPFFPSFLFFFILSFHCFHFCWDVFPKKKRGYTSVGSNVKNCRAFYVLGHPWLIPQK